MAVRSFLIFDYLENIGTSVIYQPFLSGREQLTKAEKKETQPIASNRVY